MLDCLVVGQGVAGSLVAWGLRRRQWKVGVFDAPNQPGASRVATGLMTLLTGRNLTVTWRGPSLWREALATYAELEGELKRPLRTTWPSLRVFQSTEQRQKWRERRRQSVASELLGDEYAPGRRWRHWYLPHGAIEHRGSCRVDLSGLVSGMRAMLREHRVYHEQALDVARLETTGRGYRLDGIAAQRIVFCEGHRAAENPLWRSLKFRSARGDVLDVCADELPRDYFVHAGVTAVPIADGYIRLSGNYDWDRPEPEVDRHAGDALVEQLQGCIKFKSRVERRDAGVRPIITGRHPVVGEHPHLPGIYFVNGLGSKGVLQAPSMARYLVDRLDGAVPPDVEIDLAARLDPTISEGR